MKFSAAQQRAIELMHAAPDGIIRSGPGGVSRTTVEALERMGQVVVARSLHQVERRGVTRTVVAWQAMLRPQAPATPEVLDRLDDVLAGVRPGRDEDRVAMAGYVALTVSADDEPDPQAAAVAYAHWLRQPALAVAENYRLCRMANGKANMPAAPATGAAAMTDFWVATAEPDADADPDAPGRELCRVHGATHNAACIQANSLLNRRGGYRLHRLRQGEIGSWLRDFRSRGRVLRLTGTSEGRTQVSLVDTGQVLLVRDTAEQAEYDARMESFRTTS